MTEAEMHVLVRLIQEKTSLHVAGNMAIRAAIELIQQRGYHDHPAETDNLTINRPLSDFYGAHLMQSATQIIQDEDGELHGIDGPLSDEDKADIRRLLALQELQSATAKTKEVAAGVMAVAEPAFANMLKRSEKIREMGYSLDADGQLVKA